MCLKKYWKYYKHEFICHTEGQQYSFVSYLSHTITYLFALQVDVVEKFV